MLYVHNRKAGLRPIACGVGGEICAVDTKDGKIVRIRPFDDLTSYAEEELEPAMRSVEVDGKDWLVNYNAPHRGFILSTKDGFEGVACGRAP